MVSFCGVLHLTALLPIELCTSYVPKFRILRAHGLITRSENWLLFSTASFQPLCKYHLEFIRKFLLFSMVIRFAYRRLKRVNEKQKPVRRKQILSFYLQVLFPGGVSRILHCFQHTKTLFYLSGSSLVLIKYMQKS